MYERALIVDDSLPLHKLIKSHLDGEGLEFHSAYGGESAIAMATQLHPSLILLDVDMPDLDGFEVCRRLKSSTETATIPVIFLTADFDTSDKVKGLDLGAVDYVTKPFKPEELSARVRTSLRSKRMLDQKAMVDGLTGLWNQKYLEDHMAAALSQAHRTGRPLGCIAMDVDGMRLVNRKHGAPFGDAILRSLSSLLLAQCRAEDAVCHCDGGKFTVLVSGMNRAGAGRLAERLCQEVREKLLAHDHKDVGITCSFGVADNLVTGELTLLERADLALLRAKQNGGNSVSIARPHRADARAAA